MPYKSNNTNQQSRENMGDPTGRGTDKAGINPVGEAAQNPDRFEELKAKYTGANEDEPAQDLVRHKNRNLNKPDIDKPAYS